MANKETRIYKTDTLESLRQKSNEISLHLGDNEQLNALMADKTYVYSASAGDTLFAGSDTSSPAKTARFEVSPAHTVDNTGGYIILEGVSSIASSYIAGATIYQGTSGSPSWSGIIVSASTSKILVRDSSGTFTVSSDLKVGASSPDTIAHAKVIRIVIESYPIGIVRVYKNNSELTQDMSANGFHVANIKATITQTGSPTLTNYTEGVTIYQGDSQATQALVEANATWYGTLHSVSGGVIRVKTYSGSFNAGTLIRALGSTDTITGANHGALVPVDSTYGSYIELNTPAASGNAIKVFSLDVVAAINELQDDIGTVESLTTAANDLVLAINEHDAELGTITAGAMGTTASTVSTAIREHEDQIGNESISTVDAGDSNNTITGALNQLHNEVGDVTSSNLGTSASNLTAAVREHEDQIGNENITSIDSGSDTITGALNQLHTEVGDLNLHTNSSDLTEAINELEEDLFNAEGATKRTRSSLLTTDKSSIVDSINELHSELFVDGTGVSFTGLSADFFKEAIEELRTELGNHAVLDTNVTTDAVSAINELENVLRDDTTQRTGYVMGTNANNVITAINEIENVLRGANSNYTLNTAAQNVRDAINEHEQQIGNMVFGTGGPVDAANSTDLSAAVRVLDAEIGDTSYTDADLTTAIKNIQDDINVAGSLTTLNTTNKFIVGAINETDASIFNSVGSDRRTLNSLSTADKTSIVDSINEIYADIHTAGSVTLDTQANFLVGAINEIEGVFDASAHEISAGSNAFTINSGAFTINSDGDITLDADGGDIKLNDGPGASQYGSLTSSGTNLVIKSGTSTMLTGSGANATFNNNLTVENNLDVDGTLNVDGATTLNGTTIDGNLDLNGSVDISVNAVIHGTTELNSSLGVDGDFRVGAGQGNKFNVTAASGNTQIDGTLEVDGTTGIDGNFRVGASGASKFDVVAATGNTQIDGTLEVDGTAGIDGNLRVGANKFNVTAATGNTQIDGTLDVDGNFEVGSSKFNVTASTGSTQIDGTLDVDGNFEVGATKFNVTAASGSFVAKGTGQVDGHTDLNSTVRIDGITTITNTTESSVSSATDGALIVTGGASIGKNLYVGGNLQVEGTQTVLNTETLTVEDTLVLAGNNLVSEPSTGGFGLEVGPITSPSGVASNVTGAHSIVYNYGHDNGDGTYGRWEADGSLILSSATLATPQVEGADFGPSDNLTFTAGSGLSESVSGFAVTYNNTDKGSSQNIFKTITINGVSSNDVVADSNSDTLNLRGLDAITLTSVPGTDTISIDHDNFGTAGTYGQTGTQDGQYIKSVVTNAQGHITGVTTADFDTRYQATNPSFEIKVNNTKVDDVFPGDKIDLIEGVGIDIAGSLVGTESNITISHQDTSSVGNLSQNNSGNTFIQDLAFTFDTFGHVTGATASTGTVTIPTIGNGTFTVSGSSGLSGSGSMTANQTGNTSAGLINTDKGSSQNIFKRFIPENDAGTDLGTITADNNNDILYIKSSMVDSTPGISLGVDVTNDRMTIAHANTSGQGSVNNSGRTYIQDITLDTYGHITAISSATESYVYTPPTYAGDDINIDTGALTGATVISDLDFNITTNTYGHVTDANATVATRNLTLANLGWDGWDLYTEGTKRADINVNGIVNFADDGFLTTTYSSTNNTVSYGHPASPLNGTYGGNDNGIVIESVTVDTRGHLTAVGTRDLDGRFDNYQHWHLTADSGGTAQIDTNETVDIAGGNKINTVRSGNTITVNLDTNHGFLTTQRTATLDVQGNSTNPYIRLNDGTSDHVQVVGGGTVTVTGSESLDRITITGADTNTDINVNDANLRARLAGLNPAQGVVYIGDSGNDLDLRIRGNLRVEGTQTIMNTETVTTHDNKIELNSNAASTPTEDAGIIINRGSSTNAQIYWSEANDRWYHTYGDGGTAYVIPLPSESMSQFTIHDGDTTQVVIGDNKEIKFLEGTTSAVRSGDDYIQINWTDVSTGSDTDPYDLSFAHKLTTRTDPAVASTTLAHSGTFSAVTGVTTNATGHLTAVNTSQFTLPAGAVPNNGQVTMAAGVKLHINEADKNFTMDQSNNQTITFDHDTQTQSNTTSAESPASGGTFTVTEPSIDSTGHVTGVNTKTITLPIDPDTNTNQLTTFQVEDGDGTEVTISHGKEWKFIEGNDIDINWTDVSTGSDADPFDLTFTHKDTTRSNTTTTSAPGYGGTFTAISAVTSNARGHVTGVQTKTVTIPASDNTDERYTFDCVQNVGSNNNPYLKLDGSTENPQYVLLNGGSNVTVTRTNDAALTISANNDNTYLDSVTTVDNGADMILRHAMTSGTNHDVGITAGTNISVTPGTKTFEIATSAEVNQNAFSTFELGTYSVSGGGTDITANSKTTEMKLQFWADSFTTAVNNSSKVGTVRLKDDQSDNIYQMGRTGAGYVKIDASSTNGVDFVNTASGTSIKGRITSSGVLHMAGDIIAFSNTTTSDVKLKENIQKVDGALELVSQLDGVTFNWKKDGKASAGVIAQNVEDVLPSAVKDVEDLNGDDTHKVVDYNQLSALFIEAIKELKEENKLLRAEIESLKDINS